MVTRNTAYKAPGAQVVYSLQAALDAAATAGAAEAFIIGGGEIYRQALERGDVGRVLLTHVDAEPEGDTFFDLNAVAAGWDRVSTVGLKPTSVTSMLSKSLIHAVMNEIYMGVEHVTDLNGYDHMLYLLALVAWANLADAWRVVILATALRWGTASRCCWPAWAGCMRMALGLNSSSR